MKTPTGEQPRVAARTIELVALLQRELTICFGGFVAIHEPEIPDKLVWSLSRRLSRAFRLQREEAREGLPSEASESFHPHPAVTLLIAELGAAGRANTGAETGEASDE